MSAARLIWLLVGAIHATTAKRPHVLMVVVDDLGWNDVGWHDQFNQINTPKLNALVKDSVTLSQYYVYRFCSPTRSTFMTGRYPWHTGQHTEMNLNPTPGIACGINKEYQFLPAVLKKAGYRTAALGKWHLGYHTKAYTPTYRGFDTYLGYYSGAEWHFSHLKPGSWLNSDGSQFEAYDLANNTGDELRPCLSAIGNASATYSTYLFGNETLRILEAHDPSVPFFAYLAWDNVHTPNEAPENYNAMHQDIENLGRRNMSAMLSALDDGILAVVGKLKEKSMWDDTIFIFTTDNGANLGGAGCNYPLRGGKYTFWQGGVRAVGFVGGGYNFLPKDRRGTTWEGRMHAADWYTTIAGLAGVSVDGTGPVAADGVDVWPSLTSGTASPRTEVVLQISTDSEDNDVTRPSQDFCDGSPLYGAQCEAPSSPSTTLQAANGNLTQGVLLQQQWKLIYGYPGWKPEWDGWIKPATAKTRWQEDITAELGVSGESESEPEPEPEPKKPEHPPGTLCVEMPCLYNIEADPYEKDDVSAAHPQIVERMVARLKELADAEVTVKASELCNTEYGSDLHPGCLTKALETGFWLPWLEEPLTASVV